MAPDWRMSAAEKRRIDSGLLSFFT